MIASADGCFVEAGGAATRYIQPTDPQELAQAIAEILGDPPLAGRMVAAGRQHAEGFDGATLARRLLAVYDAVIADRPLPTDPAPPAVESPV